MEQWLIDLIKIVALIIILVLVYAFKNQIAKGLISLLEKVTRGRNQDNIRENKDKLSKPTSWIILVIVAMIIYPFFLRLPLRGIEFVEALLYSILLVNIAHALIIVTDIIMGNVIADNIAKHVDSETGDRRTALSYLGIIIKAVIIIFAVFLILEQWMDNVQTLIAGLGVGGIALALAAQDTASNLVAGLAIMLDKPFDIGDWVETDTGSGPVEGSVAEIGLRSCRIRALDGSLLTVPNSIMGSSVLVNGTKRPTRFVSSRIPVSNDTTSVEMEELRRRIQKILAEGEDVLGTGTVHFTDFERDAYVLTVTYNTSADINEHRDTKTRVNSAILTILEEMNVSVAELVSIDTKE